MVKLHILGPPQDGSILKIVLSFRETVSLSPIHFKEYIPDGGRSKIDSLVVMGRVFQVKAPEGTTQAARCIDSHSWLALWNCS